MHSMNDQVSQSMDMLSKFESMPGLQIDLSNKYQQVLKTFGAELQLIAAVYETNKTNPDILRNMSPTAGRIAWARQLYERIEVPMNSFQKHPHLLKVRTQPTLTTRHNEEYNERRREVTILCRNIQSENVQSSFTPNPSWVGHGVTDCL